VVSQGMLCSADELGLSINTVGSRLSKCLNKLREMIEKSPAAGEVLLDSYD
jgi:tRNA-binding EMAP/Myf-like protein